MVMMLMTISQDERGESDDREAVKETQLEVGKQFFIEKQWQHKVLCRVLSVCILIFLFANVVYFQREDARGAMHDQGTICHKVNISYQKGWLAIAKLLTTFTFHFSIFNA